MTNPIPSRITTPIWDLWLGAKSIIPGVRLGGIYANNSGYHNTRNNLQRGWPNSYAIRLEMDKKGPGDKAAGIDLTMSDAEMRKRTEYLRRSDLHPDDNRLRACREFIGTRDSEHVYCRIAGNSGLGQRHGVYDSTRDKSHLWHIHISILRAFIDDWSMLAPILSVLKGETWEEWKASQKEEDMDINPKQNIPVPDWSWVKTHPKFKDRKGVQDGLWMMTILVEIWASGDLFRQFYDEERARDTAMETVVNGMAEAIRAGGGNVDTTAILSGVDERIEGLKADIQRAAQAQSDALRAAMDEAVEEGERT